MKSFALFAAVCAVALSVEATKTTASAAILDFNFSFTDIGGQGTVTGEVDGLSDNSTGPASKVILDSFPAVLGPPFLLGSICSTPCNTAASPWMVIPPNDFTVSNGQVTSASFDSFFFNASGPNPVIFFTGLTGELGGPTAGNNLAGLSGPATFTAITTPTTPLPAALPLFATGLGALGLLGWRRTRKSRVSLLGEG
jgi:hypothetical protein